jgi:hypothetical protein
VMDLTPIKPVKCTHCQHPIAERRGNVLIIHSTEIPLNKSQPIRCGVCKREFQVSVDNRDNGLRP